MYLFCIIFAIHVTNHVTTLKYNDMKAQLILFKKTAKRKEFMIRLTDEGKRSYRTISVPFAETDWNYDTKKRKNELQARTPRHEKYKAFLKYKIWIEELESKYQVIIDDLILLNKPFSFDKVFSLVDKPKTDKPKTVFKLFDFRVKEYRSNEKHGTAESYKGTLNKLKTFFKKDMLFNELNDVQLVKFKKWMLKEGLSKTTVSIHLRQIRSIWNYAIQEAKVVSRNEYPFENRNIMSELKTGYKSRAISQKEVNSIRQLRKNIKRGTEQWHACNYFLFGYLGRGINFQDIARLKWDNYSQGVIRFVRYKTRSKIQEETSFTINEELAEILSWYRKHNKSLYNHYIFPVLNPSYQKESSIYNRIKKIRKDVNSELKKIGEEIGSEIPVTTYTWRHSFAAIAKNDLKVDVSMISEVLGHHDLETTKHYLKQFSHDDRDTALIGL